MRLVDVDEMRVVRRDAAAARQARLLGPRAEVRDAVADGVVKRRIGEAAIAGAVEADAVQLQLQRVVAVARGVEQDAGLLVDLHQRVRLVRRRRGERRDQPAAEIVEIEIVPAVALRLPDEAPAVGEKHQARLGRPASRWATPRAAPRGTRRSPGWRPPPPSRSDGGWCGGRAARGRRPTTTRGRRSGRRRRCRTACRRGRRRGPTAGSRRRRRTDRRSDSACRPSGTPRCRASPGSASGSSAT